MGTTSMLRGFAGSIGQQQSLSILKNGCQISSAVTKRPSNIVRNEGSKFYLTVLSRNGSTGAAVTVSEDVYTPPVSYTTSVKRDLPRDTDGINPLLIPKQSEAICYSWVGLTGGQIFREMMRQHGVKHICKYDTKNHKLT